MSCGCTTPPVSVSTRAAMCQVCPRSVKNERGSAITCTFNQRSVQEIAFDVAAECPLQRFDSKTVHWVGVEWLGVPEPIRWLLTWQLGRSPLALDGCGCIAKVKAHPIGKYLEPWLDGVATLRMRFAAFLGDWQAIQ